MAKTSVKAREIDTIKLQEIIGRALTDQKFAKRLRDKGVGALGEYKLDRNTLSLIQRGLKLEGDIERLGAQLEEDFGLKYQSV